MALQHLRSSTADKRPTPAAMSDGQLALNTNLVSPGLFFKDSNGDSVKIGPVHVGTTAPNVTPGAGGQAGNSKGEQWLDTSSSRYVFKIWDGTAWRTEDGEFVNASGDTMTGALVVPLASAATPSLTFTGDLNTGIFSPGADQVAVATNGVARLTTSTTAVSSSLAIDHPLGAVGTPSITFTGDLNTGFYSPAADTLAAVTAGSNRLHITSGGLVGIGSSSPAYLAEIVGGSSATTTALVQIRSNFNAENTGSTLRFVNSTSSASTVGAEITSLRTTGGGSNDLLFSNSGTERLRITQTGVLQIADAGNITVGTTTGTKIGTATTQKLGFYNATPVVQPTAVADATTAVDVITQLNALLAKLRTLGIIAT